MGKVAEGPNNRSGGEAAGPVAALRPDLRDLDFVRGAYPGGAFWVILTPGGLHRPHEAMEPRLASILPALLLLTDSLLPRPPGCCSVDGRASACSAAGMTSAVRRRLGASASPTVCSTTTLSAAASLMLLSIGCLAEPSSAARFDIHSPLIPPLLVHGHRPSSPSWAPPRSRWCSEWAHQ